MSAGGFGASDKLKRVKDRADEEVMTERRRLLGLAVLGIFLLAMLVLFFAAFGLSFFAVSAVGALVAIGLVRAAVEGDDLRA